MISWKKCCLLLASKYAYISGPQGTTKLRDRWMDPNFSPWSKILLKVLLVLTVPLFLWQRIRLELWLKYFVSLWRLIMLKELYWITFKCIIDLQEIWKHILDCLLRILEQILSFLTKNLDPDYVSWSRIPWNKWLKFIWTFYSELLKLCSNFYKIYRFITMYLTGYNYVSNYSSPVITQQNIVTF